MTQQTAQLSSADDEWWTGGEGCQVVEGMEGVLRMRCRIRAATQVGRKNALK